MSSHVLDGRYMHWQTFSAACCWNAGDAVLMLMRKYCLEENAIEHLRAIMIRSIARCLGEALLK